MNLLRLGVFAFWALAAIIVLSLLALFSFGQNATAVSYSGISDMETYVISVPSYDLAAISAEKQMQRESIDKYRSFRLQADRDKRRQERELKKLADEERELRNRQRHDEESEIRETKQEKGSSGARGKKSYC